MNENYDQVLSSATDVEVKVCKYDWLIKNYGSRYRYISEEFVESRPIVFDVDKETEWVLSLCHISPKTDRIDLNLKSGTTSDTILVELSLLNTSNKSNVIDSSSRKLNADFKGGSRVDNLYLNYKEISGSLPDGTLIVRLKVTYHYFIPDLECFVYQPKSELLKFDGFEKLFDDKKFSDAQVVVQDHVFDVHKCILSDRSTYFSNEFENDMKEGRENKVVITDVSFEVMQEILRYIYTGKVDYMDDLKVDILIASDKYLMDGLKILCEVALIRDFKIENILDMLKLADKYNSANLRTEGLKFYKTHRKEITATENFRTAVQEGLPASILIDLIEN